MNYLKKQTELDLEGPFTSSFDLVLKYIYEGTVEFSLDNAVQLLALADFYQINELKKSANEFIVSNIIKENALIMLQQAVQFNSEEVISKCLQVFAKNFSPLIESGINLNSLPATILVRLLKRNNLSVASETVVYKVVCDYINANKNELKQDQISELFETVRFPFLTVEQIKEIESNNPLVPRNLLFEALLERIKWHEEKKK